MSEVQDDGLAKVFTAESSYADEEVVVEKNEFERMTG